MTDFKMIAKNHLKGFTKALSSLLRQRNFDLIVAPADSGSGMIGFAEIVAAEAGVKLPHALIIPIFSENIATQNVNNDSLVPQIANDFSLAHRYQEILFLDDEINLGGMLSSTLNLMQAAGKIDQNTTCTILAEGNGRIWDYPINGIRTDFLPYALRPNPDWHDLIFNLVPNYLLAEFQDRVDINIGPKESAVLLFGLPLKGLIENDPFLDEGILSRAEKYMPSYFMHRKAWVGMVGKIISEALMEQQAKEKSRAPETGFGFGKLLFDF